MKTLEEMPATVLPTWEERMRLDVSRASAQHRREDVGAHVEPLDDGVVPVGIAAVWVVVSVVHGRF